MEESGGSDRNRWRKWQFGLAAAAAVPLLFVGGIDGWPWDGDATTAAPADAPAAGDADPVRIQMARLKVDALVDPLAGNGEAGALSTPRHGRLGWLEAGPEPGEMGRAVVLGHSVGAKAGEKDVFAGLGKAKVGDTVVVTTAGSEQLTFKVVEVATYRAGDVPAEVYSGADDLAEVAMIAPAGKADKAGAFPDRVVVTAELSE
ncbi:MAG: class F sortase [Sporichthyaceae bacterium]